MNPQVDGISDGKRPELCILEDYPDIYIWLTFYKKKKKKKKNILLVLIGSSYIEQF